MTTGLIKLSSIAAGGLVLCLLVYLVFLNPSLNQLSSLSDTYRQKTIELATLQQQITAYKNAQADLSKAVQKEQILEAFLTREGLVAAVKSLEAAASASGTEETLKINDPEKDPQNKPASVMEIPGLEEIPYRALTLNDYLGTIEFLKYLEHLPQFSEISKMTFSAETVDSDNSSGRVYTGKVFGTIDGVFFVKSQTE